MQFIVDDELVRDAVDEFAFTGGVGGLCALVFGDSIAAMTVVGGACLKYIITKIFRR